MILRSDIEAALWSIVAVDGWLELPALMLLILIGNRWAEPDGRDGWQISEEGATILLEPHPTKRLLDDQI